MARSSRDFGKGIVALLLMGCAGAAFATPVKYTFTTDTTAYFTLFDGTVAPLPDNPLLASLSGHAVTGSFYYDADAPVSFTVPAGFPTIFPNNVGSTVHDAALTNLMGSINGTNFSDGIGSAHIGNETWNALPNPPGDFLQLTGLTTDRVNDFVGDPVNGLALTNARLFWIEYQAFPAIAPDFVPGPGLLGVLPSFAGRVALDFTTSAGSTITLFRDNLIVTRVSEPESLAVLLMGLAAVAVARRRARAASATLR